MSVDARGAIREVQKVSIALCYFCIFPQESNWILNALSDDLYSVLSWGLFHMFLKLQSNPKLVFNKAFLICHCHCAPHYNCCIKLYQGSCNFAGWGSRFCNMWDWKGNCGFEVLICIAGSIASSTLLHLHFSKAAFQQHLMYQGFLIFLYITVA